MIQIAIVENEESHAKRLIESLTMWQDREKIPLKISRFTNGLNFIEDYKPIYDVVFMDIDMPLMDGLTAANKLRNADENVTIVFVTLLAQYAINGYAVNAMDYIVKPVKYAKINLVMKKVNDRIKSRDNYVMLASTGQGMKRISVSDIYYLEVYDNNVIYHTVGGKVRVRKTLSEAEKELPPQIFSRCNRCYLINLKNVTDVVQNEVIMEGGDKLIISRPKRKQFLSDLVDYWGR